MTRRALKVGLLVTTALLGLWLVAVRGYADFLARIQPERALAFNARQPEALLRLAEAALLDERNADAEAFARRIIAVAPLEGRAFRILGAVADLAGDNVRAAALMADAARLSPRDTATQFWLVLQAIHDHDLDAALARVDRLLRFQPETQSQMMPLLSTFGSNPAGAGSLARLLAASPPWRAGFFAEFSRAAPTSTHLAMFVNALRRAGGELTPDELGLWATRLTEESDWPRLKRLLAQHAVVTESTLLGDGDFELDRKGPFGGWTLQSSPGIEILREDGGRGGHALRVEFFDRRAQIQSVEQSTLLDSGSFRMTGQVRLEGLAAARGLQWSIRCRSGGEPLGRSELLSGTRPWSAFAMAFQVPPSGCGAQVLRLEVSARIAAEQQVKGIAWFDDLAIAPLNTQPDA